MLLVRRGRALDAICRGYLRTDAVAVVVLDEADEILSRGFSDQLKDIFLRLPNKNLQIVFVSATLSPQLIDLESLLMVDPLIVDGTGPLR